jgi:mannosyltransferase OCH1-like enzyme
MNLIFICVFHQTEYINLLKLLVASISQNANIDKETTEILIITSPMFKQLIQTELDGFEFRIDYYVLDLYSLFEAGCARLNIFKYDKIEKYDKILYLDTDILINSDINVLFNCELSADKIHALEEGIIGHEFWGGQFFDLTQYDSNMPAFTSGILLFKNSNSMKSLFASIEKHIAEYTFAIPSCLDQPFIVYNAITQNKYDNQLLKSYVENNPSDVEPVKIIYHFPGVPGAHNSKFNKMTVFWQKMNEIPKVLFQTNKVSVDADVRDIIKLRIGDDWKYEFYNDDEVIQFFINNKTSEFPDIIAKYNLLINGAHKADLFRYYYLYIKGGFFMDSDAMLYSNIANIVKNYNFISVNSSRHPGVIFQGIIGCSAKNEIVKRALRKAYNTDPGILEINYHYFCKQLYEIIHENSFGYNIKLYQERQQNPDSGDDIVDGNELLFKHYWKHKIIPLKQTPYADEFTHIYNTNYWIKGSGTGSYIENTILYNKFIVKFIKNNNIKTVTDIGCGDWQSSYLIYQQLDGINYMGLDCVKSVIEKNKENHPQYNFLTLDILCNTDLIRDSDVYIIKDVLQHWKLADIYSFLDKLVTKNFRCIIITNNGNQTSDNLELNAYIGNGRGLKCDFLPLKKYGAELAFEYFGDETKHVCIIRKY